ncbi:MULTISPECIES: ABC transporter permease subunit [Rhizobium/Agrobacterium group]|uniref:ABC transporter permease n=1 Tax=Rhizobium/Agrobacterium group TaxID=227290 RepID=UPI001AD9F952|nr:MULTISPECIES: ABC transporter permease subunit [Rhizobium/Agrobacterium group]MBO9112440.1 ABC transporter permease subunit [Agrobacterium sp. S2/73]QXZ75948.1 ABC transporter permease subunit [Agrobacterium sp. S7/73]QYA17041.1 ABC transporter permease subunit [Rhizobium sp. AB2/73]UEQ85386.1 ABC transporter permease subunit [Rhizobium sp. AB2/73]
MTDAVPIAPVDLSIKGSFLKPHRIVLMLLVAGIVCCIVLFMRWDWLPRYLPRIGQGVLVTLTMLFGTAALGFLLAVPLGLLQVTGPSIPKLLARGFCTIIRGTPLLLQLWLLYYGLGSLFPQFPAIRQSWLWPYLREAWPYGVAALTISFAAYEGEIMRGAFAGVPAGELEAARAYGMSKWTVFRRIWLPRAMHRALPTLSGETVLQLKSTPLIATITVTDVYAVISKVRQETYLTYEPLLLLALIYMLLTGALVLAFRALENRIPTRRP